MPATNIIQQYPDHLRDQYIPMPPPESAYQSQSQWMPDQRTQTNYNNWQQPPILPQDMSLQPSQQQKPVYNQIQQNWPQPPMNLFPGSQQQIQHQQQVPIVIQVPATNVVSDENNISGGVKSNGKPMESSEGKSESNSAEDEETITTEAPKVYHLKLTILFFHRIIFIIAPFQIK